MSRRVSTRPAIAAATVLFAALAACQAAPATAPSVQSGSPVAARSTASPDVGAPCAPKTVPFNPNHFDLTGPWAGDPEGAIFYLRQIGTTVWWNAMSSRADPPIALGRDWNNVGHGEITDLAISVDWASVPRGQEVGSGTVTLSIGKDSSGNIQLTKTGETGSNFGVTRWTPCTPG